jgi:hypothetical protein
MVILYWYFFIFLVKNGLLFGTFLRERDTSGSSELVSAPYPLAENFNGASEQNRLRLR